MTQRISLTALRENLIGLKEQVPLIDGTFQQYVNFDNGASTPTFNQVQDKVNEFLRWYSNVHRGTGFKSQLASWVFEEARDITARFVDVNLDDKVVLFTKNTTESINKLARHYRLEEDDVILTSVMEHHSNELPWRSCCHLEHIAIKGDGSIDMDHYKALVKKYAGRLKLVAITGASNVTGFINPIHEMAEIAHEVGAEILVDAAQLAPHRPIDVRSNSDPGHIDFLAFSAHKMYAPYGIGVLIGKRKFFLDSEPDIVGGGTVALVTLEQTYWTDLPEREEAGTPDIIGVVALAAAIKLIEAVGWDEIIEHEKKLTTYALEKMQQIPEIVIYGSNDPHDVDDRLGVISFNVMGIHHALTSAILNYEGAIGVRNGCFCAHPYLVELLHISDTQANEIREEILAHDRSHVPGAVRVSFGMYNSMEEVDRLIDLLKIIARREYKGDYKLDVSRGEFHPSGFEIDFPKYFSF